MSDESFKDATLSELTNPTASTELPPRDGGLVVPIPTLASAHAAVDATLDSADEADMREILNTQGDLHERGSNEANAENIRANAKTADELAVTKAVADLESAYEAEIDKKIDEILASPEINDMLEAALIDEAEDGDDVYVDEPSPANQAIVNSKLEGVYSRILRVEQKVAVFEILLNEFKERALAAFKHAGFKF